MNRTEIIPPSPLTLMALMSPNVDVKYVDGDQDHKILTKVDDTVIEVMLGKFPLYGHKGISNIYTFNQN